MAPKFCAKCLDEEEEVAATHHCPTCDILLCEVHLMLHNKVAKTKGHAADVVEVKEEEEEKKQIMCQMCMEDDEEIVALYFCPICKLNICELHLNLHNKMSKTKTHEKEVKVLGEDGLSTCSHCQAHCPDDFVDAVYACRECKTNLCYHHAKIHTLGCNHAKNQGQTEGCSQLDTSLFRLLAENKFKQFAGEFAFVGFLGSSSETHDEFFLKGREGKQPQQFNKPHGLKINIYTKEIFVCDTQNCRIQIFDLTSRVFKREMKFFNFSPMYLDFDLSDDTMVISSDSQTVAKYTLDGRTLIWEYGKQNNYTSTDEAFGNPRGVAVDNEGDGNIYIAEWNNDRVKVLTRDGKFVKHFSEKQLWTAPQGLAIRNGNLLVNSRCYGQGQVAELKLPEGEFIKSYGKKQDLDPELHDSCYMCVERFSGNIVIADTGDSWTAPIKFIKGQSLLKLEKPRGQGKLHFNAPTGIDIDPFTGLLYVCDTENHRVQILK